MATKGDEVKGCLRATEVNRNARFRLVTQGFPS